MTLPVYLDNHATTRVDPRVVEAMLPYFTERYGNASSRQHRYGWEAEAGVEAARSQIAGAIGAGPEELFFTSGATESVNLALKGVVEFRAADGAHIITAAAEHHAVLDTCSRLEQYGYQVTVLPVDCYGRVSAEDVRRALRKETILVTLMAANNEIGSLMPLEAIGAVCRDHRVLFHTDATQAVGKIPFDLRTLPVDLVSFAAHKLHGPKGVGALFVRGGAKRRLLERQMDGGGHERGLRSGTLNVPGIVGFGKAVTIAYEMMNEESTAVRAFRDRLVAGLTAAVEDVSVNGHPVERLPHNASLTFHGIRADTVMMDLPEIALSSGSACSAASPAPSHVLKAIGLSDDDAQATLRFGLSRFTTGEEIDYAIRRVADAVRRHRERRAAGAAQEPGRAREREHEPVR